MEPAPNPLGIPWTILRYGMTPRAGDRNARIDDTHDRFTLPAPMLDSAPARSSAAMRSGAAT
jgi:hypothetical protein